MTALLTSLMTPTTTYFVDVSCEYPSKAWLDPDGYHEDLAAAHSSCNVMQPELHSVLVNELMTKQNRCPVRPQRAAPVYPDTDFRPFDGSFAAKCCICWCC
jgi:hypothetical protein